MDAFYERASGAVLHNRSKRRCSYAATGNCLVQGKRNRFLATEWMKYDQYRDAMFETRVTPAQAGITFNDKAIVLECAHVSKTGQVANYLATDAFAQM
jgi:hypothetical protein